MKHLQTIKAAIEAGQEILKIYDSADFGVEMKSDNSPLTLADKAGHNKIMETLTQSEFPTLSEESDKSVHETRKNWNTYWLVDPLDGTKEFIKKNGEFTVNIALIENNTPIFGVIFVPVLKKLFFTHEGSSYLKENISDFSQFDSTKARKLSKREVSNEIVIVASKSHLTQETEDIIAEIQSENPTKTITTKSVGSSLKLCLVAEGLADFYPRYAPTMEWDIAAGHAICKYANITVNQAENKEEVVYNKENLLNPWFEVGSWK